MENQHKTSDNKAREVVLAYIKALNDEDFEAARKLVNHDLTFDGVLGKRDGADAYFKDMEKMKFKYKVHKVFSDGNDVCLFYDVDMGSATALTSGWYHLKYGKISSLKVIFDPRPILEASNKK
ncbi:nuclear transport factor 2 family protein [Dyadobacter subterraneus]|uniref:Nuclear transport factor 2 family protein n=1 Tax=Dyadobacter subterraneus TaxID=2773304 RepID=A0ABR9WEK9_9BACT|nr:nuclear transport factor 2 family protein [Dyadobacter subterraneus]MBE9463933.1 nuclear transport factor 2 family protein [Dyadobacter subterraneus]